MSRINDFILGIKHLAKGFTFLASHPRLWLWATLPSIINLIILAGMIAVFFHYYGGIYDWLTAHIGHANSAAVTAWYWHIINALLWILNLILQILIVLISLIILLIIAYAAGLIIASPFNDALSERVEIIASGYEPPPFSLRKFMGDILRTIKIESIKALILLAIPVVLFVFNFIPAVGGFIYVILTMICGSWSLGFSYADLPNGRRVIALHDRLAFARRNRWALAGFGIGFVIPFFSLLFAAPMVVGGTLLYIELNDKRRG